MSITAVSMLERGVRRAPQRETFALLAKALELSVSDRTELEAAADRARSRGSRTGLRALRPEVEDTAALVADNLPTAMTSLVGRDDDIRTLLALFIDKRHRLITITGPGGVGKSRLAIETARALTGTLRDGVWIIELAPVADPQLVAATIASVLGVALQGARPPTETLQRALRSREVLLVLDNCEHLLDGVAHVVTALNSACPGVSILATSREHLRVQGEKTYTASPLTYPTTSAELTTAARYPAVQLFMTRASLLTDFELNPGNLTAVCDIVRSLDGLPLAIELVVPSLRVLNIQDLASRLRSRLALHQHGPRGAPLRHQSLRGLIDWSYERLPDDERFVFRCCSVFAGYFTIEAVSAVCSRGGMHEDDVLRSFSALVDKSLVFVNGDDERRYALLEIIKEYAARALGESGAQEAALRDHASFYLETARRMMDSRTTASLRVRVEQLKTDTSNFQAALSWCLSCKRDPELGAALALALYQLFEYESDSRSGHWFERALELLDPESAPELWAGLVVKRELPSHVLRQMPEQIRNLERAVAYYRDNADANQYCEALGCLCNALTAVGDRAGAKHTAAAAVRVARELNVPKRLCWALRLSAVALGHDEPQQQIAYLTECLRVYDNSFADEAVVFNLGLLGEAEFFAGLPRAALEHTRKALDVLRTMPTLLGIVRAMCLGNAAVYHLALDEFDEARAAAQRALQLSRDADDPMFSAFVIQHLAFISAKIGNLSRAALLLGFSNARTMSVNEAKVRVEIACRRRLLTFLADKLDAVELAALLADGALWSEERAVTEALNV